MMIVCAMSCHSITTCHASAFFNLSLSVMILLIVLCSMLCCEILENCVSMSLKDYFVGDCVSRL